MPNTKAANPPKNPEKETPLMQQYNQIKQKYPGALVLFRVGDFYETFGEDAVQASAILNITLTKRSNGAASEIELAGFPYHALDTYMPRLIKAGYRVAICDQLEDPKSTKGIVKRGVTELITPGLSYNDNVLDRRYNNYLASLYFYEKDIGIAFLDISTGEFLTSQGPSTYIEKLIQSFSPSEIIVSKKQYKELERLFGDQYNSYSLEDWAYQYDYATEILNEHFNTVTLKGFGIEKLQLGIISAGAIMRYLEETEHKDLRHINSISRIEEETYVWLDSFTIQSLELIRSQKEEGVSLLEVLDKTKTPMGSRLLIKWILFPLKSIETINERLNSVEVFVQNPSMHNTVTNIVKHIGDLERLASKVSIARTSPRELASLSKSLSQINPLKMQLMSTGQTSLKKLCEQLADFSYLLKSINSTLNESLPITLNHGHIIREGINEELDNLRKVAHSGKDYLLQIQREEIKKTGISSLKIGYNKVFGYYLEVTNVHKAKVPSGWIRKQTLANAERYITEELKDYEEKILSAEQKYILLEQQLFQQLVASTAEFVPQIQQTARIVAQIDCFLSFAQEARQHKYCKPNIDTSEVLSIKEGRHPVIEQQLPISENYVPNDVCLDHENQQIIIVTGPNMSGKSALLRQTALIVIMAQIGSFVPASSATIGFIDKIFTRVGASDNIAKGESTFMTEMTETASIMNNLSNRSLVLMDEIGRGTSTYDGISIAWAIVEFIHNHPKYRAKTLFATHYHELNNIAENLIRVKNYNVSIKEIDNKVLFLRKLQPGGSNHSFGINVANMAGMPQSIIKRAKELLHSLEKSHGNDKGQNSLSNLPPTTYQLSLIDVDPGFAKARTAISAIDIDTISPIEALLKLNEIKKLMNDA
jgi:DNA mismatch repair protein MutS